jgi:hypothetical protein
MFQWLKNLFSGNSQELHIHIHIDGELNVKRGPQEIEEREPTRQKRDPTYFIPKGPENISKKSSDIPIEVEGIDDITLPEADFGREES